MSGRPVNESGTYLQVATANLFITAYFKTMTPAELWYEFAFNRLLVCFKVIYYSYDMTALVPLTEEINIFIKSQVLYSVDKKTAPIGYIGCNIKWR